MVKAIDLVKQQLDKDKNKDKIFKKIYKRIETKIIQASARNLYECWYEIPEFILNLPLYNMEDCKQYLIKKLINDGFIINNISINSITISWKPSI
jgi:hypothetical protein